MNNLIKNKLGYQGYKQLNPACPQCSDKLTKYEDHEKEATMLKCFACGYSRQAMKGE